MSIKMEYGERKRVCDECRITEGYESDVYFAYVSCWDSDTRPEILFMCADCTKNILRVKDHEKT